MLNKRPLGVFLLLSCSSVIEARAADLPGAVDGAARDRRSEQAIAEALDRAPPLPVVAPPVVLAPPVMLAPPAVVVPPCYPISQRVWNGYMYVLSQSYDHCGFQP